MGGADVYLRWLSLTTIFYVYFQPVYALALATNNTKAIFKVMLIEFLSKLILSQFFCFIFQLTGLLPRASWFL